MSRSTSSSRSTAASSVEVATYAVPTATASDSWTLTLTQGASTTSATETIGSTSPSSIAGTFATDLNGTFAVIARDGTLVVTGPGSGEISFSLAIMPASAVSSTQTAATLSFTGSVSSTDVWSVALGDTSGNVNWTVSANTTTYSTLAQIAGAIQSNLDDAFGLFVIQSATGNLLTITAADGEAFTVDATVTSTGSAATGTATTQTLVLSGPVDQGDSWTLDLNGSGLTPAYTAPSGAAAPNVASAFAPLHWALF